MYDGAGVNGIQNLQFFGKPVGKFFSFSRKTSDLFYNSAVHTYTIVRIILHVHLYDSLSARALSLSYKYNKQTIPLQVFLSIQYLI